MNKYLLVIIVLIIISCRQPVTSDTATPKSKYSHLLASFKEISFDTLEVLSLPDENHLGQYKYKGVQVDSADASLAGMQHADVHEFFACYKFKIDSSRLGLIARTPSAYYPSSVKLFIYNIITDTLTPATELADYNADAGEIFDTNSWLVKDAKNIYVFKWVRETLDNAVENEHDKTISEWNHFSRYDLSNNTSDTLGNSITKLPSALAAIVTRKQNAMRNPDRKYHEVHWALHR